MAEKWKYKSEFKPKILSINVLDKGMNLYPCAPSYCQSVEAIYVDSAQISLAGSKSRSGAST